MLWYFITKINYITQNHKIETSGNRFYTLIWSKKKQVFRFKKKKWDFLRPNPITHIFNTGFLFCFLTHWGRVTHICVSKLAIIGSDHGLSPGRHKAMIWTNAGILLIRPSGTNFSEILIGIDVFSFRKMHLKMASGKWRPFCLGLNELNTPDYEIKWCVNETTILSAGFFMQNKSILF